MQQKIHFTLLATLLTFHPLSPKKVYADTALIPICYKLPSTMVEGVSLCSGVYSDYAVDLITDGIDPLVVDRHYDGGATTESGNATKWTYHVSTFLELKGNDGRMSILYPDDRGGVASFSSKELMHRPKGKHHNRCPVHATFFHSPNLLKPINPSTVHTQSLSGQQHLDNVRIEMTGGGSSITAYHGDGRVRTFSPLKCIDGRLPKVYKLVREILPSGNQREYDYGNLEKHFQQEYTLHVRTRTWNNQVLNGLKFNRVRKRHMFVHDHEGKQVSYTKQERIFPSNNAHANLRLKTNDFTGHQIKHYTSVDGIQGRYYYDEHDRLYYKSLPEDRSVKILYKGLRVDQIQQPIPGQMQGGSYETSHSFYYPETKDRDHVGVILKDRSPVEMLSEGGKLLEYKRLHYPIGAYQPKSYSKQKFYWGGKQLCEDLQTIALCPGETNHTIGCRTFTYDTRHNVTEERLYGNLSGNCTQFPTLDAEGRVTANQTESTWHRYRYSEDGFNLLLQEEDLSGKIDTYTYKPWTNLLTSKLVGNGSYNIHRTFHTYNNQGARIETIVDDGAEKEKGDLTGVTMRRVTRLQVKEAAPCAGDALSEEEFFLNERGELELLHKRQNRYNDKGKLIHQKILAADGQVMQETTWEYNEANRLICTTGSKGRVEYDYDVNGNQTVERLIDRKLTRYHRYDRLNHLVEKKEIDDQGREMVWNFVYNVHGECTQETNPLGHMIYHRFDSLGREIETEFPALQTAHGGEIKPVIKHSYDLCDFKTETIDAEGRSEKMTYNLRGQITRHLLSDGSIEVKEYTPSGTLKRTISRLGLITDYETDCLGRTVCKREYDAANTLLSRVDYSYQGLLLRSEQHENGPLFTYTYDGAGRLIKKEQNGQKQITYFYDAMSRLKIKQEWINETCAKVTTYEYDQLDHVTLERISDLAGNILSETRSVYDLAGNQIEHMQLIGGKAAVTKTHYDAWNRMIQVIDAQGNSTHYRYETEVNRLGQKVLKVITIDPSGCTKKVLYHANDQIAEEEYRDQTGSLLKRHALFYNAAGQMVWRIDSVYTQGRLEKEIITEWIYDKVGRLKILTEARGTPEERQTQTTYYPDGQVKSIQFTDGTRHQYCYDIKGRCLTHYDSPATFYFTYRYDRMGRIIEAIDQIAGNTTRRFYDLFGRLEKEELGNGLGVLYQYDLMGRVTQVMLPDGSCIAYHHDPAYLRQVTRLDPEGKKLYTHHYEQIDQSGNTTLMHLAGAGGTMHIAHNLKGLVQSIEHPEWKQHVPAEGYDNIGNLLAFTIQDGGQASTEHYQYDKLNQLTSEKGTFSHNYTYDSLYNRQFQDGIPGLFNSLNQLLGRGKSRYQYHRRGWTLAIEKPQTQIQCIYDGLGRLCSLISGNMRTNYRYDPFHRRLSKTTLTQLTPDSPWVESQYERFLYFDQNEVGSYDRAGQALTLRLLGRGRGAEIGSSIALELGDKTYLPIHDLSGSIAALLDFDSGKLVESTRYSAFGIPKLFNATKEEIPCSQTGNPWGYASKRLDLESGWSFFGRRYYNAEEGRWITPDPLGFSEGPNLYAYVQNSPMTHFDLYGLAISFYATPVNHISNGVMNAMHHMSIFYNNASHFLQPIMPIAQMPGKLLEGLSRHLLPIPGARDVLMGMGRVLSFRPFEGCEYCREYPCENFSVGTRPTPPQQAITWINGIGNKRWQAQEQAERCSRAHADMQLACTYDATYGLSLDLLRSVYMMFGGTTEATRKLAQNWDSLMGKSLIETGKPVQITHYAHSQGGQITSCVPQFAKREYYKDIEVKTYGSAKLISQGVFKDAQNYVSTRDSVPFIADPFNYIRAKMGRMDNVHFLPGSGFPLCDHAWGGKTYDEQLQQNASKFLDHFKVE